MHRIALTIAAAMSFALLPACGAGEEGEDIAVEQAEEEGEEDAED